MTHILYIATSPSNRRYIGITNNFKRRMKEHRRSKYPFGQALRKYGQPNFTFTFVACKDLSEAYELEELAITSHEVKSPRYYNISKGGRMDIQMGDCNPMRNPDVLKKHTALFTTENNPMNDPRIRQGHNAHQKKPVSIVGVRHNGVRDAAKALGCSRQKLVHRLKSVNYPDHYYV